ncbi:MAG: pilus assembly protein PilV [Leptothrix sp. (in: b-proteobacteria)]
MKTIRTPHPRHPARRPSRRPARAHARGFVLIEALIAILIFSFGALGLLGLQVSMMKATSGAKFRADAAYLADDLVGRMWADGANLAGYNGTGCASTLCTAWRAKVSDLLPGGSATLAVQTIDATNSVIGITISWTVPNEGPHSYATSSSISR